MGMISLSLIVSDDTRGNKDSNKIKHSKWWEIKYWWIEFMVCDMEWGLLEDRKGRGIGRDVHNIWKILAVIIKAVILFIFYLSSLILTIIKRKSIKLNHFGVTEIMVLFSIVSSLGRNLKFYFLLLFDIILMNDTTDNINRLNLCKLI